MDISSMLSNDNDDSDTNTKRTVLFHSIDTGHLDRVRKVLKEICTENTVAFELACAKLLTQEDDHTNEASAKSKRRLTQRFETCMQCKAEYDTTNNPPNACHWHPGRTEPDHDDDFWVDHNGRIHEVIDSNHYREECPEGFKWTCCGKLGDAKACMVSVHKPDNGENVKAMPHDLKRSRALTAQSSVQQDLIVQASVHKKPKVDDPSERMKHCIQCENMYDTANNTETSCIWHTGDLEPLYESEVWGDHDERIHGRINTEEHKKEFPEGFEWDCCQRRGDEAGCEVDVHRFEI